MDLGQMLQYGDQIVDVHLSCLNSTGHPALLRMWDKRQRGYKLMGYRVQQVPGAEQGSIAIDGFGLCRVNETKLRNARGTT